MERAKGEGMHSLVRTFAFLVGTTGIAAIVACSGSDGAPEGGGDGTQPLPSSTTTSPGTTATSTNPTQPTQTTNTATDGGMHDGGGTPKPTGTKGALGSACTQPTDCESGVCYVGGQASYCSLKCTQQNAAQVCAPPTFNGVCNKQGFCRLP
jgi:hypothetical protein